jgi:hypothetical protein
MVELYVPIEATNVCSVIPPGEEILCSTLICMDTYNPKDMSYWNSHLLVTEKGLAFTVPQRDRTVQLKYQLWADIPGMEIKSRLWHVLMNGYRFFLTRKDEQAESKESLHARDVAFFQQFIPILIARKKEWLAANPGDKKRAKEIEKEIKNAEKTLIKNA